MMSALSRSGSGDGVVVLVENTLKGFCCRRQQSQALEIGVRCLGAVADRALTGPPASQQLGSIKIT
jgi:hypothetical protein